MSKFPFLSRPRESEQIVGYSHLSNPCLSACLRLVHIILHKNGYDLWSSMSRRKALWWNKQPVRAVDNYDEHNEFLD